MLCHNGNQTSSTTIIDFRPHKHKYDLSYVASGHGVVSQQQKTKPQIFLHELAIRFLSIYQRLWKHFCTSNQSGNIHDTRS